MANEANKKSNKTEKRNIKGNTTEKQSTTTKKAEKNSSKTAKKIVESKPKVTENKSVKKVDNSTHKKTKKSVDSKVISMKHPEVKNIKTGRTDEVTKFVELVLIVLVIFAAFYLITYWVSKGKKEKTNSGNNDVVENKIIQYDEILVSRILSQHNSEYYVLIVDKEDSYKDHYQSYVSAYKGKEGATRIYTASFGNVFNDRYKSEESNLNVDNIDDLKVKTTSLLKIVDHKVVESTEGRESIQGKFSELTK